VGDALGEALGEEDSATSSGVVFWRVVSGGCVSSCVDSGRVFSLIAGTVDGECEAGCGVSRKSKTTLERVMATAYTPTSKIGASTTVRG
jgi:hypothetical protein